MAGTAMKATHRLLFNMPTDSNKKRVQFFVSFSLRFTYQTPDPFSAGTSRVIIIS